jgi:tRNA methyl transferase
MRASALPPTLLIGVCNQLGSVCPLQAQLARVMFPLAPLTKGGVRALAAAARLPNRARRDSQGICFLGKVQKAPNL